MNAVCSGWELVAPRQSLDRGDVGAIVHHRESET